MRTRTGVVLASAMGVLLAVLAPAADAAPGPSLMVWPGGPVTVASLAPSAGEVVFAEYPSGALTAAWFSIDGLGLARVYAADRSAAGAWSAPVAVSTPGVSSSFPDIVATGEGTAVLAWQTEGATRLVQTSQRSVVGSWSTPVAVSSPGQSAAEPSMVVRGDSTLTLSFTVLTGSSGEDVAWVERGADGVWGVPTLVTHDAQGHFGSHAFLTDSGETVIAWLDAAGVSSESYSAIRRSPTGSWGRVTTVASFGAASVNDFQEGGVDVGRDGTVAATWWTSSGGTAERSWRSDGTFSVATTVSGTIENGERPVPTVLSDGTVIVTFEGNAPGTSRGTGDRTYVAVGSSGGPWAAPVALDQPSGWGVLDVVRSPDDTVTVVSSGSTGSVAAPTSMTTAVTRGVDGVWQPPVPIAVATAPWPALGSVVALADGTVAAAFYGSTSTQVFISGRAASPPSAPAAPTGVTVTPGAGAVRVGWAAVTSDGGSWVTRYTAVASPGAHSCSVEVGHPALALACTISGLVSSVRYDVRVTATNLSGDSVPSAAATGLVLGAPAAPRSVVAGPRSRSAAVSWLAPSWNGGSPITTYRVTASPGGHVCTSSTTTCVVTGLTNGRTYSFAVSALSRRGAGTATRSSRIVVGSPTQPRSFRVAAIVGRSATVGWRGPRYVNAGAVQRYLVRTSSDGGRTWGAWSSVGRVTTGKLSRVAHGSVYQVQVAAQNVAGLGLVAALSFRLP